MFKGSIVAIITPFAKNGVDYDKLEELVEFQIKNGTSGILPCGTTGESPTLSHDEHKKVIETCIDTAKGRVPIMAGTGSNSTAEAIELTKHAEAAGADAALVVTPYYNKPTQKGLYLHFKAVANSVKIPIVLYNIEGRCARNIETPTVVRLANDCKNIIGVKEASGSLEQMQDVINSCPDDFTVLSGDDALTLPLLKIGGKGVVSVIANILPKETAQVVELFNEGKNEEATSLSSKMFPLIKSMFIETNPIPIKTAMGMLGMCSGDLRLPLCEMEKPNKQILKEALKNYGLL